MVAFEMLTKFWLWIAYSVSMAMLWAAGLHEVYGALLILQGLDIATGMMVALKTSTFRSAIGKAGIQRRIATWVLILAVAVLQQRTCILDAPADADMGVAEWLTLAMTVIEFFSIMENASLLGVKIPSWLLAAMDKAKAVLGLEPRPPRENGK